MVVRDRRRAQTEPPLHIVNSDRALLAVHEPEDPLRGPFEDVIGVVLFQARPSASCMGLCQSLIVLTLERGHPKA